MRRPLIAVALVAADLALVPAGPLAGAGGPGTGLVLAAHAVGAPAVVLLRPRHVVAALVLALALSVLAPGGYVLLIWACFQAGADLLGRRALLVTGTATVAAVTVQAVRTPHVPAAGAQAAFVYLGFAVLPLITGRYLAQNRYLVSSVDRNRRQQRWQDEALAERERLHERLRIARDMHDSLGHRLSLVSVQAAALEVSGLPPGQHEAVRQLARSAREAMDELYDMVSTLRGEEGPAGPAPGVGEIPGVVEDFRHAGVEVTYRRTGTARPLSPAAAAVAYHVVQEGLTNAAKHAAGRPVTVTLDWEADALLLNVSNPLPEAAPEEPPEAVPDVPPGPAPGAAPLGGHGLAGLEERARPAEAIVGHTRADGVFRLWAVLPLTTGEVPPDVPEPALSRPLNQGLVAALLVSVCALLPLLLVAGVGSR